MNFLRLLIQNLSNQEHKKTQRKTIAQYQNDLLMKQSKDQFKKLLQIGQMPVTFL